MKNNRWTVEQQSVLDANGNILVSASAGSGKTTVMVEKIKNILLKPIPIESVLVLSYTVASAADMRTKIISSLYDCTSDEVEFSSMEDSIKKQIDDIPFSDISTVDSFCTRLIRENFQRLELDSSFSQMDNEESDILKRTIMREVFTAYKKAKDEVFATLLTRMSKITSDDDLTYVWLNLYDSIYIHPDPISFMKKIETDALNGGFNDENQFLIVNYIKSIAKEYRPYVERLTTKVLSQYTQQVIWVNAILKTIDEILNIQTFADWQNIKTTLPVLNVPDKSKKVLGEDLCAEIVAIRDSVKALVGEADKYLADFMEAEVACETQKQTLKLLEIIKEFKLRYDRKKTELRKLDFLDLSRLAIELLADDDYAKEVQNKFSFIFVDEYQDINPLQEFILQRISNGENLFMVGDSKQSIYAFRGSDSQILLEKKQKYTANQKLGSAILLTQNFRSQRNILEFADQMFSALMTNETSGFSYHDESAFINEKNVKSQNMDTIGQDVEICLFYSEKTKPVIPVRGVYSVKNHEEIESGEMATAYYEGVGVANKIKELVSRKTIDDADGEKTVRKFDFSDIAILMTRRNSSAKNILRALKDNDIPYSTSGFEGEQGGDILKIIINIVRVIDNSQSDIPFAGYLLSYFGGFCEDDIMDVRQRTDGKLKLVDAVLELSKADDELGKKCLNAIQQIKTWRFEASHESIDELLKNIISDTGFDAYVLARPQGREELYLLNCFLSNLASKDAVSSTTSFLNYYDNLKKVETPEIKLEYGNTVKILTVHGSKGLEFPVVFVCQTNSYKTRAGEGDILIDKNIGIGIRAFNDELRIKQNSVAYNAIEIKHRMSDAIENIRLLYVALTRAKDILYISGTMTEKSFNNKIAFSGSVFKTNSFLDLIMYAASIDENIKNKIRLENTDSIVRPKNLLPPVVFNAADLSYKNEFESIMRFSYPYSDSEKISPKYTVSELNRLSDDSEVEYTPHLYSVDAKERGIAYHIVMENIDFSCDTLSEVSANIEKMVEQKLLKEEQTKLVNPEEIFACITNPIISKNYSEGRMYREQAFMLKLPAESVLDTKAKDDVLIQGTIDLLILGNENILIDYKNSALVRNNLTEKYKKQLYLYVLAVEKAFGVKIHKKCLYSFKEKALIDIT